MKRYNSNMKALIAATGILLSSAIFSSCSNDGYSLGDYRVEIATVKPEGETVYSLILDDSTTLWPAATNVYYKPKKNQRAMVNYTILSDKFKEYDHAIKVNDIIDILTKDITTLNMATADSLGNDPVQILNYWIGDGYLNIHFATRFTFGANKHFINLAKNDTVDIPNLYEFRHNAYGDLNGTYSESYVAFNLNSIKTDDATSATFILKVKTFEGDKETKITYNWGNNAGTKASVKLDNIPRSISEVE